MSPICCCWTKCYNFPCLKHFVTPLHCLKEMSFFLFAVYGNWRFIRSCAFLGSPGEGTGNENFCTMRTGTYNVFMETCTCNSKDGCNTTSTLSSWSSLFLLFVSITFYIFDMRLLWCCHWNIMKIRPVCVSFYFECVKGKYVFSSLNEVFLCWMCVYYSQ